MRENFILSKSDSPRMFDAIAGRYDFLNRILSLGQDTKWRQRLREYLPSGNSIHVLDLACGTADVLIALAKNNPAVTQGVGVDLAHRMLLIGRAKISAAGLSDKIILQAGDAQALQFLDESFDCVSIAFGIRNVPDLRLCLLEMYRVSKKGGRVLILESSKPTHPLLLAGHWLYINTFVPLMGFLFSGHGRAYRYLSQTIQSFPSGDRFCKILKQFGLINVQSYPLMGGAATIYVGEK